MTLETKHIPALADAIKFYYGDSELMELCTAFDVELSYPREIWRANILLGRVLLFKTLNMAINRRFLQALVVSLV